MKKIGIITICDINYGNRLQCYALQKYFELLGFQTENIINYGMYSQYIGGNISPIILIKHTIRLLTRDKAHIALQKVLQNYNEFEKNIHYSNFKIQKDDFESIASCYDSFFVGSDQVWNPYFMGKDADFLYFVDSKKRNAFSASFGIDKLPDSQVNRYKKYLLNFNSISVREDDGAKIVKELTGKDVPVLIDPTLLLRADEWRRISKKPKKAMESGYVLTYFLSEKCIEAEEKLNEIKRDKVVYELLNIKDKITCNAGPSEFLWLFDHADLILTDSFHACVFSFLFNKPFLVYDRKWENGDMNSRLKTLLKKFSLERKYNGSGLANNILEHDYIEGYKQLELEREKATAYLMNILKDE